MQMPTKQTNRCLYQSDFKSFIEADPYNILGRMHNAYHGKALTTTDEAWLGEIQILKAALMPWKDEPSDIIFEYDIPRLGKRIDVVLLLRGIIFCLEFKVGQKDALQCDIEQVMDYALDLKNFHRYSHDRIIVPTRFRDQRVYAFGVQRFNIQSAGHGVCRVTASDAICSNAYQGRCARHDSRLAH